MSYPSYAPPPVQPVNTHRGLAIAALVLGIVGAVFGFIPITFVIALICGVLALIFGLIGRRHGMGKAGLILGIVAIALGIWGAVIVNQVSNDLNDYGTCIQNAQTLDEMSKC
jgi:hypothetical protein